MRAVVQRVKKASVRLPHEEIRATGKGFLIYLGVGKNDNLEAAQKLAEKCVHLRLFANAQGKFDRSIIDEQGEILLISQFTLYGNPKGGRRPDFTAAAAPQEARKLYESFTEILRQKGLPVKTGEFGAHMLIESVNDGPVTLWLDTDLF